MRCQSAFRDFGVKVPKRRKFRLRFGPFSRLSDKPLAGGWDGLPHCSGYDVAANHVKRPRLIPAVLLMLAEKAPIQLQATAREVPLGRQR